MDSPNIQWLPDDILVHVFQYLNPEEVANLKLTSKYIAEATTREKIALATFYTLLHNLNILGACIPTIHITPKNILAGVLEGIRRVNENQKKEVLYLIKNHPELPISFSYIKSPTQNIAELQERKKDITKINHALILSAIENETDTTLDINDLKITQFPDSLLKIQKLKDIKYWENLEVLFCDNNQLLHLPTLDNFVNLKSLSCKNNKMIILPNMENCLKLQCLSCEENQLTSLPLLKNCKKLQFLFCDNNQISSLSEDLLDRGFTLGPQCQTPKDPIIFFKYKELNLDSKKSKIKKTCLMM